jgi:hypothetical protein
LIEFVGQFIGFILGFFEEGGVWFKFD